jgi:nicotinate-nucleotide adenylyltransferase
MTARAPRLPSHLHAIRTPIAHPGQRIGLMGGTFDPPHGAHLANSKLVLRRLGLDRLWWLVTPGNPLKSHSTLAPLAERLEASRRFARHPAIEVTAFEESLGTAYTAETLMFLKTRFPGVHFVWIMGGDNLAGFHRWRHWRRIVDTFPIAIIDRPAWRLKALASPAARTLAPYRLPDDRAALLANREPPAWVYLSNKLLPHSSTAIRSANGASR